MPRGIDDIIPIEADASAFQEGLSEVQRAAERLEGDTYVPNSRYEMVRTVLRFMGLWALVMSFFIARMIWALAPHLPLWGHLLEAGIPGVSLFAYLLVIGRRFDRTLVLLGQEDEARRRGNRLMKRLQDVQEQLDLAISESAKRSEEEQVAKAEQEANQAQLNQLLQIRASLRESA